MLLASPGSLFQVLPSTNCDLPTPGIVDSLFPFSAAISQGHSTSPSFSFELNNHSHTLGQRWHHLPNLSLTIKQPIRVCVNMCLEGHDTAAVSASWYILPPKNNNMTGSRHSSHFGEGHVMNKCTCGGCRAEPETLFVHAYPC